MYSSTYFKFADNKPYTKTKYFSFSIYFMQKNVMTYEDEYTDLFVMIISIFIT